MEQNQYDYSPINAVSTFWLFASPMILILILVLYKYRVEIWSREFIHVDLLTIQFLFVMSLIIGPILATLLANSFPALRIKTDGLEVRFYFPKVTKWIFISWNEIDGVEFFPIPIERILGKKGKNLFIRSKRLPFYYFLTALFFKNSFSRGVIIMDNIKKYDELVRIIALNKDITG